MVNRRYIGKNKESKPLITEYFVFEVKYKTVKYSIIADHSSPYNLVEGTFDKSIGAAVKYSLQRLAFKEMDLQRPG